MSSLSVPGDMSPSSKAARCPPPPPEARTRIGAYISHLTSDTSPVVRKTHKDKDEDKDEDKDVEQIRPRQAVARNPKSEIWLFCRYAVTRQRLHRRNCLKTTPKALLNLSLGSATPGGGAIKWHAEGVLQPFRVPVDPRFQRESWWSGLPWGRGPRLWLTLHLRRRIWLLDQVLRQSQELFLPPSCRGLGCREGLGGRHVRRSFSVGGSSRNAESPPPSPAGAGPLPSSPATTWQWGLSPRPTPTG